MLVTAGVLACMIALAVAAPASTPTLKERSSETCSQYGEIETADFTMYNNLWGEGGATSGSQCTTANSASGNSISWSTSWSWSGGSGIKSYANAGLSFTSTQLSKISSINTSWKWSYTGSGILADVAYDTVTSSTAGGSAEYEVMVWMDAIGGAEAISSSYSSSGAPVVVATTTIGGISWHLYKGPNGDTTVFSFLPANGAAQNSFSGNLMLFYDYLISYQGVSSSQYLTTLQAGTEATKGSNAVFTTSSYTIAFVA